MCLCKTKKHSTIGNGPTLFFNLVVWKAFFISSTTSRVCMLCSLASLHRLSTFQPTMIRNSFLWGLMVRRKLKLPSLMNSVTRLAKFHHVGKILKVFGPFLKSLFSSWQNFEPTLANKNYDFGQIIMYINALTLNNWSSHLATLLHEKLSLNDSNLFLSHSKLLAL